MGYTTKFIGSVELSRKLTFKEARFWMDFVENDSLFENDSKLRSYLQWVPSYNLDAIVWDGNEKFYNYVEALEWICRWLYSIDIVANGTMFWRGESSDDIGLIKVQRNIVYVERIEVLVSGSKIPLTLRDLERMALKELTEDES